VLLKENKRKTRASAADAASAFFIEANSVTPE